MNLLLILIAVGILAFAHASKHVQKRMVNGDLVEITDVPYTVFVEGDVFNVCTGAVISSRHVVTAAHCTMGDPGKIKIRAGSSSRVEGGSIHHAKKVTRHELFALDDKQESSFYDIAVIRVAERFDFASSNVQPIKLFRQDQEVLPGMDGFATGWGQNEHWIFDKQLRKLSLSVVDKVSCNETYKSWGGIKPGQFCAKNEDDNKYPCYGDSGGPMVIKGRLAGLGIYGGACEQLPKKAPSVFTEVAYFHSWIDKNTR